MKRIGVDLGGTKIEAVVLDLQGDIVWRKRVDTPKDYVGSVKAIAALVGEATSATGAPATVGIGMPGSLSPRTGLVRNANSQWLNGKPFLGDLEKAIGHKVRLANDANCFALSEAVDGAGAGAKTVFGVIVGTGCGGGVVINGQLIGGAHGIGGEWGHVSLPWPGADEMPAPKCWCGLEGCLETWISGSGFQADYARVSGETARAETIVERMRDGDDVAAASFERYASRLGRALAMVANIIDPDVIVLGGGLSNINELYDRLPRVVSDHVFSDYWEGVIRQAKWGDSSGVRGAAWLWPGGAGNGGASGNVVPLRKL